MPALFVLYVFVTLAQIALWLFVFGRLARIRPALAIASAGLPPVSVIICARNEAHNLRKYLPAVLEQQYPHFEVLVVDDDSTDDTNAVLTAFQANYTHLRVLRLSPKTSPGKKYALAQGIEAARYEYLVFTDADCTPASVRWLEHLVGGFHGGATPPPSPPPKGRGASTQVYRNSTQDQASLPFWGQVYLNSTQDQAPLPFGGGDGGGVEPHSPIEIVLGYAPYSPGPGLLNRWIRFETIFTAMQYFSFALAGRPYMGVGRNLAWHKSLFQRVGGFVAHAHVPSGDDDLLVNAAAHAGNTALCLAPEAFVYSDAESTWADWFRQKRRHLGAGKFYRREHQIGLGLLTLTQVLHYFLLFVLLFSGFGTVSVILFVVRLTVSAGFFKKILRQFRDEPLLVWFPLLDALLAIYFAVLVPLILIRSNHLISWK